MFFTIYRHKVPGVIEISRQGIEKRIYINDGNVIHASSTDRTDRLGAHLYRSGKLSRDDLEMTMCLRAESGKRHGEILIEHGLLSPRELYQEIRRQMEEIVWSLFSWDQGEVTFKIGEFNDPLMIKIHLPMRHIIVRGITKVSDTKSLVAKLGKKNTIFRPTYDTEGLIEVGLDRDEYALLRLVDGRRCLYDICTEGPFSVSENARRLYGFHVLLLIQRATTETPGTGSVKIRLDADRKV